MAEQATTAVTPAEIRDAIEQPSGEVLQGTPVANEAPPATPIAPVEPRTEINTEMVVDAVEKATIKSLHVSWKEAIEKAKEL